MQQQLMRQSTQMLQQPRASGMNQMPGGMNQAPGMNQMPGGMNQAPGMNQMPAGMSQMPGGMNQPPGMNQMPRPPSGQSSLNNAPQSQSGGQNNLGNQPANFIRNSPLQNVNSAAPASQVINLSPATGGSFVNPSPFDR
jgi:hypothetical protein